MVSGPYVCFLISNVDKMSSSFGSSIAPAVSGAMFNAIVNTVNNPQLAGRRLKGRFINSMNASGVSEW